MDVLDEEPLGQELTQLLPVDNFEHLADVGELSILQQHWTVEHYEVWFSVERHFDEELSGLDLEADGHCGGEACLICAR